MRVRVNVFETVEIGVETLPFLHADESVIKSMILKGTK